MHRLAIHLWRLLPIVLPHGRSHQSRSRYLRLYHCILSGLLRESLGSEEILNLIIRLILRGIKRTNPIEWNQTAVTGSDNRIDPAALAIEGLPYFATT